MSTSTVKFFNKLLRDARLLTSPNASVRLLKKKAVGYQTCLILTDNFFISKNKDGVYHCQFAVTDAFSAASRRASNFVVENSGTENDNKIFSLRGKEIRPFAKSYASFPLEKSSEDWQP